MLFESVTMNRNVISASFDLLDIKKIKKKKKRLMLCMLQSQMFYQKCRRQLHLHSAIQPD